MTTAKQETTGTTAAPAGAAEAAMTEMQRAGLGNLAWMSAGTVEALMALGNEVSQFVAARIAEDVKTQHALLACREFGEAQRIQMEFVQKALTDYTAETGRLVELGAGVMSAARPKRLKDGGPV